MLNSDEAIVKVVKGDSQYIGAVFGGFWGLLDIQAKFRLSLGSVAKLPGWWDLQLVNVSCVTSDKFLGLSLLSFMVIFDLQHLALGILEFMIFSLGKDNIVVQYMCDIAFPRRSEAVHLHSKSKPTGNLLVSWKWYLPSYVHSVPFMQMSLLQTYEKITGFLYLFDFAIMGKGLRAYNSTILVRLL